MQFTTVFTVTFTIFGLLGQGIMAAPAPIAEAVAVAVPEAAPEAFPEAIAEAVADGDLVKRGFGCNGWPFEDDKKCHNHCKSIKGYKGGYCAKGGFVCKCY